MKVGVYELAIKGSLPSLKSISVLEITGVKNWVPGKEYICPDRDDARALAPVLMYFAEHGTLPES